MQPQTCQSGTEPEQPQHGLRRFESPLIVTDRRITLRGKGLNLFTRAFLMVKLSLLITISLVNERLASCSANARRSTLRTQNSNENCAATRKLRRYDQCAQAIRTGFGRGNPRPPPFKYFTLMFA